MNANRYSILKRRRFLKQTCGLTLGGNAITSTLLNLNLAGRAAAANQGIGADRKTMVCIFFGGGMDSFNLLVPRDDARYQKYAASRSNVAVPQENLIPLTEAGGGAGTDLYGLHPSCPELADMFNGTGNFQGGKRLSFVSNVGTLIEPTTLDQYFDKSVRLPRAIASHFDQTKQWQTALPQGSGVIETGWAGRAADILQDSTNLAGSSMSTSLSGNNIFQVGLDNQPFTLEPGGELGLSGENPGDINDPLSIKNRVHRMIMQQQHEHVITQGFSDISRISLLKQEEFKQAFLSFDESTLVEPFPNSRLGNRLKDALKLIFFRENLGLCRQTIYINSGSWDMHQEVINTLRDRLVEVSNLISIFQRNLDHLGLADGVVGFSASEFGRTLRSNGQGTDHAWGGNAMVFGKPIESGKIFGKFPDLTLRGADDIGRGGQLLPSTACDEYFSRILKWFGVEDGSGDSDIDVVLPNYKFFKDSTAIRTDLNFIKTTS